MSVILLWEIMFTTVKLLNYEISPKQLCSSADFVVNIYYN